MGGCKSCDASMKTDCHKERHRPDPARGFGICPMHGHGLPGRGLTTRRPLAQGLPVTTRSNSMTEGLEPDGLCSTLSVSFSNLW